MSKKNFSPKQIEQMISMYSQGQTTRQIAEVFDCSDSTISNKLKEKGVQVRSNRGRCPGLKIKTEINEGFPKRLSEAFSDVSQAEIAKKMKKADTTISNYLKGRFPTPLTLIQISKLTGCSIHWLLTGEGEKYVLTDKETDYSRIARETQEQNKKLVELVRKFQEKQTLEMQKLLEEVEQLQSEEESLVAANTR